MRNLQEKKLHGQPDFPFAVYPGRLPEFGTAYPLHWHEELELISIQSGTGIITVQSRQYEAQAGDLFLIPPKWVHSIRQRQQEEMHYHTILFRLSLLESDSRITRYTAVFRDRSQEIPICLQGNHRLHALLMPSVQALIAYRDHRHTAYELLVYSHLYQILYHIVAACGETEGGRIRRHANYEKLQLVLEYLKEHYAQEFPIREAAKLCGFSESHFMRQFRELTGTSYAQYVKQLRLHAAAQLLRTTGNHIGEIAEGVGFRNLSYFTRAFAEKYHMPPSAYRLAWQEKSQDPQCPALF